MTRTRGQSLALVREKLAEGFTSRQAAEELGISYSYVRGLLSDPNGYKDRARKESYRGICENCGGPTTGSEGPAHVPRFCNHCAPHRLFRKWTAETVIAAIQEWARIHGRPPRATQWLKGRETRNGNGDYEFPPASACYRSSTNLGAPFESWSDAIEAAGFPRPLLGQYERKPTVALERTYIVFRVSDNGDMEIVSETEATDNQKAIERVATDAGRYASVAKGSLMVFTLAPKLVASRDGRAGT